MLNKYKELYKESRKVSSILKIFLVSNIREKTSDFKDYESTSIISEFLSLNQVEIILESLRSSGFETVLYIDEMDFIKDYINNVHNVLDNKKIIVLNTSQKGTSIGRKSLIPAFCDLYGLSHTNSNPYVVSLARHKYHTSCLLRANRLPTTMDFLYIPKKGWLFNNSPDEGKKVIIKLNYETSSIGLTNENIFIYEYKKDEFINELANKFNQPVIVQNFIEGYEVEVPVIISDEIEIVLPVGITISNEKNLGNKILDYNVRRELLFGFYNFEKEDKNMTKIIENHVKQAVSLLGITGFGRVDFRIDYKGNVYITDIATNPHITKGMSFYYAFTQNDLNYAQMLETLIALSIR